MTVRTHHSAVRGQDGFTLIELLVVVAIIGILAAIALPAFVDQRKKGDDAAAKSNARNLVSAMEACYNEVTGYNECVTLLDAAYTGLPLGSAPGEVETITFAQDTYRIVAVSKAASGGVNHWFAIEKSSADTIVRECAPAGEGGCSDAGDW